MAVEASPPAPDVKRQFTSAKAVVNENHDFFEVQLWTTDGERLRPCVDSWEGTPCSSRKHVFCVQPGTQFELRMRVKKPSSVVRWGGYVLVNKGDSNGNLNNVDYSVLDDIEDFSHTFWFGENEQEFTDTGFCEGFGTSRRYVVGKSCALPTGDAQPDSKKLRAAMAALGAIRVKFARVTDVTSVKRPRRAGAPYEMPTRPPIVDAKDESKLRMFACVVEPGERVVEKFDREVATLSPDICFEFNIIFVHFARFLQHMTTVQGFHGIPLSVFADMPHVRSTSWWRWRCTNCCAIRQRRNCCASSRQRRKSCASRQRTSRAQRMHPAITSVIPTSWRCRTSCTTSAAWCRLLRHISRARASSATIGASQCSTWLPHRFPCPLTLKTR